MSVQYADTENLVKAWLKTTDVAALVPLPGGAGPAIFLAMPKASPNPVILCRLIGGGPTARNDIPQQSSRMSFNVLAPNRALAADITYALIETLENLSRDGSYTDGTTTLFAASVLLVRWQPDDDSDVPRYIVDALVTTVT